jgi:hypothetical protein
MGNTREVCASTEENSGDTIVPHSLLYSATGFLAFMGGYTVFLGPIAGIMVTDVSTVLSLSSLSQGAPKLMAVALSSTVVLARTPLTCRRSRDVSASWKVQVYIWSCKCFFSNIDGAFRTLQYDDRGVRRTGAPPPQ